MKAARITNFGHVDTIKIEEIDQPQAGDGQVLVEVHAASINPFDTMVREGHVQSVQPPLTLGVDIAGIVVKTGSGVADFTPGQKVYGQANVVAGNSGAFAEFAATKASQLAAMPASTDFVQAAAMPLVGVSALQVITQHMNVQAGQKVLIHGGAGGIGTVAIQIAKHLGATVTTTATGEGIAYVKDLGADEVVDYTSQAFDEAEGVYDAVFDTIGGETYERSFKTLKQGGVIVSMLMQPDETLMQQYNVRAIAQQTRATTEDLTALAALIDQKVVTPHIDATYPLAQVAEAFAARESGKVKGKVVLTITD
ncbi:MAG TPA: NADP-dependent oxidoreductase [Candidatus Saccharimonadales bacterium]|nr:NADP-dependent oxidoreductase [Candidatus Saccharimonadales bacterium]